MKLNRRRISVPSTILLILLIVMLMSPFYVLLIGSFKPPLALSDMDLNPFNGNLTLKNFDTVFKKSEVFLWMKNSLIISVTVCAITAVVGIMAGYAFAKIKFKLRGVFFAAVMATMMMPKQMLLIPNYLVAYQLNLQDRMIGVILTSIAPAFGVFLSRQMISSLPRELFDAAEIDGCGELRKFTRIVVPLSLPTVATIATFSFFSTFNDYLWQLIMISDKSLKTLPVGVAMFAQAQSSSNKASQLAIGLISTIPLVVAFLLLQRFYIRGATDGAVKG